MRNFMDELKEWEKHFKNIDMQVIFHLVLSNEQFSGSPDEELNTHLINFQKIFNMYKPKEICEEFLRLRLFPLSLNGNARSWFKSLPQNSTTTWKELEQQFLIRYFPPTNTAKYINDIANFTQFEGETIYESWGRFKDLQQIFPCNSLPEWIRNHMFYNGLRIHNRRIVDDVAGGTLLNMLYNEACMLLDKISCDNKHSLDEPSHACMLAIFESLRGR